MIRKEKSNADNQNETSVEIEVDIKGKNGENPNSEVDEKDTLISELTADLQRTRADFENYRKQIEVQKQHDANVVKITTVMKFLPVIDDIDRAIAAYPEQLVPIAKSLDKTLKDLKLSKIESGEGTEFDPELHNAAMMEEGEGEKEVILQTLQPGYKYENEVVRAAIVKVGRR